MPLLLEAQRVEEERVRAAEDSQRFEYRVRNYFPHPIALRREGLAVLPHGKDRLGQVLECAEHLVHYVALCALVQLGALRRQVSLPPSNALSAAARGTDLWMHWGTSWQVLAEAVAATRRSAEPLALPFPQLTLLHEVVTSTDAAASRAQARLRDRRNFQSHLQRLPDSEVAELSRSLSVALDEMLSAVQFVADVPLVFVRDYEQDPFTDERRALFEYLRGASVVFERRPQRVDRELPRGSLGLLGHDGRFHKLAPWLLLDTCEVCKRPEVSFSAGRSAARSPMSRWSRGIRARTRGPPRRSIGCWVLRRSWLTSISLESRSTRTRGRPPRPGSDRPGTDW